MDLVSLSLDAPYGEKKDGGLAAIRGPFWHGLRKLAERAFRGMKSVL